MTAAVYRSSALLTVPPTQNTAPVLEFDCLYTHDLRRKQKRWQDGFVRYHTFNKRVMLYDVPRNFIGDMHWKAEEALQEGDEMTLEKTGVLVQVAAEVGRTETDLTELLQSAKKPQRGTRPPQATRSATASAPRVTNAMGVGPTTQMKHRSLNALLGMPKGPLGKSVLPSRSPFEERHSGAENEAWDHQRSPKRRCTEKVARNGNTTSKPPGRKDPPLWEHTDFRNKEALLRPDQQQLQPPEVVDLRDEVDEVRHEKFLPHFSSDALQPLSSPVRGETPRVIKQKEARSGSPASKSREVNTRQEPQTGAHSRSKHHALPSDEGHSLAHAPSRSTVVPVDNQRRSSREATPGESEYDTLQPRNHQKPMSGDGLESTRSILRLATNAPKKKMLLCQDQLASKRRSTVTNVGVDLQPDDISEDESRSQARRQRKTLQERLARINEKHGRTAAQGRVKTFNHAHEADKGHSVTEAQTIKSLMSHEVAARELAALDKMILPAPPSPLPDIIHQNATKVITIDCSRGDPPEAIQPHVGIRPFGVGGPSRIATTDVEGSTKARPNRRPGAPMRTTPAPLLKVPPGGAAQIHDLPPVSAKMTRYPSLSGPETTKPAPKSRFKKPLKQAVKLNTWAEGTSAVVLGRPFQPPGAPEVQEEAPPPQPPNAWSREASDLFDWRPPGWDEDSWCVKDAQST